MQDLASHSHMPFQTSLGSAQDRPGKGHLRFGGDAHSNLLVLQVKLRNQQIATSIKKG